MKTIIKLSLITEDADEKNKTFYAFLWFGLLFASFFNPISAIPLILISIPSVITITTEKS